MSQDVSTNRIALDQSETSKSAPSWSQTVEKTFSSGSTATEEPVFDSGIASVSSDFSTDTYADHLMNDLFEDVERALDGGTKLPTESVKPEYVALQSITVPHIVLPPTLMPRAQLATRPADGALDSFVPQTTGYVEKGRGSNRGFDKLLFGAVCASLVVTLGVWLASQGGLKRFAGPASAPAPVAQSNPDADAQFVNYMQRSLQLLDQQAAASKQVAMAPNPQPASNLPTVSVPGNPTQKPATPPAGGTVLERVYIPVYQPPQALTPLPTAPIPSVASVPVPARPTAPARRPTAPAPTRSAPAQPVAVAPAPAPAAIHTLVGVLELGDRSAALFEINGVARRFHVGESIGTSGWTLVQIANQAAVVRRNGEVRSIYVGQKF